MTKPCAYCGADTSTSVTQATRGRRKWTPICSATACWKKYWKTLGR